MLHVWGVLASVAVFPETLKLQEQPLWSVTVSPEAVDWKDRETDFEVLYAPASPQVTVATCEPLQGVPTKLARGSVPLSLEPLLLPLPEPPSDPEPELPLPPPELPPDAEPLVAPELLAGLLVPGTSHRKTP